MKKIYFFLVLAFTIFSSNSIAQNRASCILGDTLELQMENYRGSVSWQVSNDNQFWTDIIGSSEQLRFVPDTATKWVRAKIEEENCPPFFEVPFLVNGIDTAAVGYQRNSHTLQFLSASLISNENGVLLFQLNSNNFPLLAGDLLSGVLGQENMMQIEAVIVHNGKANVFVSSSNLLASNYLISFGNPTTGKVMGRVLNEVGNAIAFVKVKIGNQSILTDINGVFQFENAEMFEKFGYVTATKAGFFEGSRSFFPKPNVTVVEIRMLDKNAAGSFSSANGGNVSLENVHLQFPPNAIVLNGAPFNGNVIVVMNHINPESEHFSQEMPGNLIGNKNGNIRGLTSFGMIGVEILDSLGNELQIAEGQFVTASFPLSAGLLSNAPDTIDLWSFNETQGIWQNEGEAIKSDSNYIAQLPHFSFWNCDEPWEAVFVNGTVTGVNGNPIPGIIVNVSNPSVGSASDVTNNVGQYSGLVPANMELTMSLDYDCGNGEVIELLNNIIISNLNNDSTINLQGVQLTNLRTVTGIANYCDNQPIQNGYVLSSNQISYLNQGAFTFNTCFSIDSIQIVKSNPMEFGAWQTINLSVGVNNLGTLTLCGGDTLLTDTVSDIDGNIYTTVLIGEKWWMAENLKTTRYANGNVIPNITPSEIWISLNYGAWCNYDNNVLNDAIYGKLYNGLTVSDPREVCPAGWYVPTYLDWIYLVDGLGGESIAGWKMKSTWGWNPLGVGSTNESGFSGLSSGRRITGNGSVFDMLGNGGFWWTSTSEIAGMPSTTALWTGYLSYNFFQSGDFYSNNKPGYSIRCVKY